MALPLPLPTDQELETRCGLCECPQLLGEVCLQCGLCQRCGEFADDCICEYCALDRYIDADYQQYLETHDPYH